MQNLLRHEPYSNCCPRDIKMDSMFYIFVLLVVGIFFVSGGSVKWGWVIRPIACYRRLPSVFGALCTSTTFLRAIIFLTRLLKIFAENTGLLYLTGFNVCQIVLRTLILKGNQNRVGSTVIRLQVGRSAVWIPFGVRNFSLLENAPLDLIPFKLLPDVKWPKWEAEHWPPSSSAD